MGSSSVTMIRIPPSRALSPVSASISLARESDSWMPGRERMELGLDAMFLRL
jgi:hypothetical protein